MPNQVLAYVRFDQLRGPGWDQPGHKAPFEARFYGSRSPKLHRNLGEHGTLWIATGIPVKNSPVTYALAYKLADCELIAPENVALRGLPAAYLTGSYAVMARDIQRTYHYPLKQERRADLTAYIPALRFTNARPVSAQRYFPVCLYNFPVLTDESVQLLERLERRSRFGRDIVISYAREDADIAETLQHTLQEQGLTVYRDLTDLRAGENWMQAVQHALESADALLVLLSPHSATSQAVQSEVRWALQRLQLPGGLRAIVPLLLPGTDLQTLPWERFEISPESRLRDLNVIPLPQEAGEDFYARLVQQIAEVSQDQ